MLLLLLLLLLVLLVRPPSLFSDFLLLLHRFLFSDTRHVFLISTGSAFVIFLWRMLCCHMELLDGGGLGGGGRGGSFRCLRLSASSISASVAWGGGSGGGRRWLPWWRCLRPLRLLRAQLLLLRPLPLLHKHQLLIPILLIHY